MQDWLETVNQGVNRACAELERVEKTTALSPEFRSVVLVHSAQGIIDNGGLHYFFENDFPERPPYSDFILAYRDIGATVAAEALSRAVQLFPFREPHQQRDLRREFLGRFNWQKYRDPSNPFTESNRALCGNKDVWPLLAQYIIRHAGLFHLERAGS